MVKLLLTLTTTLLLLTANAQWTSIPSPYSGNLWCIKFFDQNVGYIGGNTAILKTTDGGLNWTSAAITDFSINNFAFTSATTGYYGANNNIVRKTTNQGTSWSMQNPNASPFPIMSLSFPNATNGWAVGNAGTVRKTTDGGNTWIVVNSGISTNLTEVHFIDLNVGIFIGENGFIRRTTNGLSSWGSVSSGTTSNLYDMYFVNSTTGFIAGGNGTILKTTNGGASWTALNSGTTQWLYAICFKDELEGYAGGANGTIVHTTDGGVTWQTDNSGIPQAINDIAYVNNQFIAVTIQGKILTTGTLNTEEIVADDLSFEIYPNPGSSKFTVSLDEQPQTSSFIHIYNLMGAKVHSEQIYAGETVIDIESLENGLYIVELLVGSNSTKKHVIVQH